MEKPDGGPAYPQATGLCVGMSLRDYFAGQALVGGIGEFFVAGDAWQDYEDFAKSCYSVADAMLKAREAD